MVNTITKQVKVLQRKAKKKVQEGVRLVKQIFSSE